MLNLRAYGTPVPVVEETVLRLVKNKSNGDMYLEVVNAATGERVNRGTLVVISTEGTIRRCTCVDPSLRFQLDRYERVTLVNEDD